MTATDQLAPVGDELDHRRGSRGRADRDRLVRLRLDVAARTAPARPALRRPAAGGDGYTAQRSYSLASDPADPLVELMVECLPGGEVSGFLHDEVRVDDVLELRGPIGGWFTWTGDVTAVAIGGGTGVVPLVSMLRYAVRQASPGGPTAGSSPSAAPSPSCPTPASCATPVPSWH